MLQNEMIPARIPMASISVAQPAAPEMNCVLVGVDVRGVLWISSDFDPRYPDDITWETMSQPEGTE